MSGRRQLSVEELEVDDTRSLSGAVPWFPWFHQRELDPQSLSAKCQDYLAGVTPLALRRRRWYGKEDTPFHHWTSAI